MSPDTGVLDPEEADALRSSGFSWASGGPENAAGGGRKAPAPAVCPKTADVDGCAATARVSVGGMDVGAKVIGCEPVAPDPTGALDDEALLPETPRSVDGGMVSSLVQLWGAPQE